MPDGAGAIAKGPTHRQRRAGAACVGLAYPSPGRGLSASRRRFGRVPAVAPMTHAASREASAREGDKSVEALPLTQLDVQLHTVARSRHNHATARECHFLGPYIRPPRRPAAIPPAAGFRFFGANSLNWRIPDQPRHGASLRWHLLMRGLQFDELKPLRVAAYPSIRGSRSRQPPAGTHRVFASDHQIAEAITRANMAGCPWRIHPEREIKGSDALDSPA